LGKLVNKALHKFGVGIHSVPKQPTNDIVTIRIGNYHLKANGNHALPRILEAHPGYSANLPRLACNLKEKYPDLLMFDVGANIGDTVALVRTQCKCKIVCIEGDSKYFELLKLNTAQFDGVEIYNYFLGEENKTISGTTEKDVGTLKIVDSATDKIELRTLDEFIDKNGPFSCAKLLKIDTDGYDLKIMRGAFNYINRTKPVLFFEYDKLFLSQQDDDGVTTLEQLRDKGYEIILFYDNYGRFLLSDTLNNKLMVKQLDNYINARKGAFEYYDLCIFHKDDEDIALKFIDSEMEFQQSND
jgi:FkbM family methyltransferase